MALICAIYLIAGTIGHDPWKTEDAIHLGIAWEFASHGDWLSPRIGVEPWLNGPPFYHWVAALLGKTLSFALPFHDAARLASVLFGALLLCGLAIAARKLTKRDESAWLAPVLAIGTLGLLVPLHDAQPAIALLATQALVYAGTAMLPKRAAAGAAVAALALGIGLLSKGLPALAALLPPFLFAFLHGQWRTPKTLFASTAALAGGLVIGALWPLLLTWQEPALLLPWWQTELAHFAEFNGTVYLLRDHFELLAWFVWPVLPLSLWSLWIKRKTLSDPAISLPLLGCVVAFGEFFLLSDPKSLQSLNLIVPLVLLALPGTERLRRGASNAFDWFGIMTFTLLAGLLWLGGIAMATGMPARVAKNFFKAEPGFSSQLSIPAFAIAAALTLGWLWVLFGVPRSPWRSAARWGTGVTLTWALIATLWLPWIDFGKTYRPVAQSLARTLGDSRECVASMDVGLAQKASLRYFIGLATRPIDKGSTCPLLLIQGASGREPELKGMKKIWEGNRGGDKSERLRLYRKR